MIEAVNSVLTNAQLLRGNAEQASAAAQPAVATPEPSESISVPQAPFVSPYIAVDVNFDTAVLQIRDSETGDVVTQFPSESRLAQAQREARAASQAPVQQPAAPQVSETSGGGDRTGVSNIGQAQQASAALAAGAQAGIQSLSAGVSVVA